MIVSFKDKATEDIFDGEDSKDARKRCSVNLWTVARRKLDQLNAATFLEDMRIRLATDLRLLKASVKGSIVSGLMINIESVLHGHPKEP